MSKTHEGTLIIQWPSNVDDAPVGWHWGTHVGWPGGSGYYLIADEGEAVVIAEQRPDMEEEDALDSKGLSELLATVERDEEHT